MYHIRYLCDAVIWLDGGQVRAFGETDDVVSAYEAQVHLQNSGQVICSPPAAGQAVVAVKPEPGFLPVTGVRAEIVSFQVANLGAGEPPLLLSPDLSVTVRARVHADECPNIGVMLQQVNGTSITGITSVTTHLDGFKPVQQADGLWQAQLTFPELPLYSGEYALSAYLFDSTGLLVYEERLRCQFFRVAYPSLVPGLVRLPHRWS